MSGSGLLFFAVLQKAPYGVVLIDRDETFLYLNPEFTAITGYTLKDVPTRRHWLGRAYPDASYCAMVQDSWEKDFSKTGLDRVFKVVCKSGKVKEIEFRPTYLDDGRFVITLLDITERRRAEETLHKSREALSTVFNGVYDAIFLHGLDGTIIDVNVKMLQMYRVTRQQATKLSIIKDYSALITRWMTFPACGNRSSPGKTSSSSGRHGVQTTALFSTPRSSCVNSSSTKRT